jgi:D-alanine--D-alanine ligase
MAKVRLAVLFGGATKDHKVSLMSAYSLLTGISRDKYDVTPIGITRAGRWLYFPGSYEEIKDGTWEMSSDCCSAIISPDPLHGGIITIMSDGSTAIKRVDAVMSVLHGKYGEGGRIQALLKLSKIPYVDCDPETAMYCMDKALTHIILSSVGIDVPNYAVLERSDMNVIGEKIGEIENELTYPVYVSASSCSSSIGANMVNNADELRAGAKIAFSHHHTAIVEEDLSGRTIECVVMGNSYEIETTVLGEVVKKYDINSAAAYTAEFVIAPEVTDIQRETIYNMAKKVFRCLSFKGYAKMSFRLAGERVLLRRVSVVPGFTPESASMILMKASGYDYSDAIDRLIGLAIDIDA